MVEKCGDVSVEKKKKTQSLMLLQGTPEVWQMAVVVVLVLYLLFHLLLVFLHLYLSLSLSSINSVLSYC